MTAAAEAEPVGETIVRGRRRLASFAPPEWLGGREPGRLCELVDAWTSWVDHRREYLKSFGFTVDENSAAYYEDCEWRRALAAFEETVGFR